MFILAANESRLYVEYIRENLNKCNFISRPVSNCVLEINLQEVSEVHYCSVKMNAILDSFGRERSI